MAHSQSIRTASGEYRMRQRSQGRWLWGYYTADKVLDLPAVFCSSLLVWNMSRIPMAES
jgi:hypothetical protein